MKDQPTLPSKNETAELSLQSQDEGLLLRNERANREILLPIFVVFLSFFTSGVVGFLLYSILIFHGFDDTIFYSSAINGVLGSITSYVSWYLFRKIGMSGPVLYSLTLFSSIWLPLYFSGFLPSLSNDLVYALGSACLSLPGCIIPALVGSALVVVMHSGIAERILMGRRPQIRRSTTENQISLK